MSETTETIYIEGMSCGHCVRAVQEALEETDGVDVEDVQVGSARVRYDADRVERETLRKAIAEAGFKPHWSADAL